MIVQVTNENNVQEWSILEFQGEIVGEYEGSELGTILIKEV